MKSHFGISPKEHCGLPGQADVYVEAVGRKSVIYIEPMAASGAINGGQNLRYFLEPTIWQVVKLLLAMIFVKLLP